MLSTVSNVQIGSVKVLTTNGRGQTPSEIVDRMMNRIISVEGNPPEIVRLQLEAYQDHLRRVLEFYITQAQHHDRTNVTAFLEKNGHKDLADIIRRL